MTKSGRGWLDGGFIHLDDDFFEEVV
jgi:hypothetical protein